MQTTKGTKWSDAAIATARDLRKVNPSAMYEIRPVRLYRPGLPFPLTEAEQV